MFNRAADKAGLDYWVSEMENKGWSIYEVASSFAQQQEYEDAYNSNEGTSNLIQSIYTNFLGRPTDTAGLQYWVEEIDNGRVSQANAIIAIINGAKANQTAQGLIDAKLIANKTAVSSYFSQTLEMNDLENARTALTDVTNESLSFANAIQTVSQFAGIQSPMNSFTVQCDSSIPEIERAGLIENATNILNMYSLATGVALDKDILFSYNTTSPGGISGEAVHYNLGTLPSSDSTFYHFLIFELAHQWYFQELSTQSNNFAPYPDQYNLRPEEMIGQGLSVAMYDQYGYMLNMNTQVDTVMRLPLNDDFKQALEIIKETTNLFSHHQFDVNPDIQNLIIDIDRTEFTGLYEMDNNFYRNMFEQGLNYGSYEEYKDFIVSLVTTVPSQEVLDYVNNMIHFRQIDEKSERPRYTLEVSLFSSSDITGGVYSNQKFAIDSPDSYRVWGQSNNINDYSSSMAAWQREPDVSFYSQKANITIFDSNAHQVFSKQNVTIYSNFSNGSEQLPTNLVHGQHYTINVEATINGVALSDSLDFLYG